MKIAALQMVSTTRRGRNLVAAQRLHRSAPRARARELVALPEYFCLMGHSDRDKLPIAETPGDGPIQQLLSHGAHEHRRVADRRHAAAAAPTIPSACSTPAASSRPTARWSRATTRSISSAIATAASSYDEGRVIAAGSEPVAFDAARATARCASA